MNIPILSVEIRFEHDVVLGRQRARQIAEGVGFERKDQVRIATAISELARNAYQYAGGGRVEFMLSDDNRQMLGVRISDRGRGISNLQEILGGSYVSQTGMGLGLLGAKRLMDRFEIESGPSGTTIFVGRELPAAASRVRLGDISRLVNDLAGQSVQDPFVEVQRQNQELLGTMAELEKRQQELSDLNRELEDTNRGVVALYAELDQRADYLRRVSESKTRFLSNMTHEFRTPLNSIISLARILSEKLDGPLTAEQEKQVGFIRRAAADLAHLVNDLLDLSKIEAGKVSVRAERFDLETVFGALRGTLRPLLAQNSLVNLVFEEPEGIPELDTDESKLSQILRNFISNALKYTERGEVRVSAKAEPAGCVTISVADTGIGIAKEDQARIFEEFEQVEGPHQLRAKGTGLGLPLAKSLAELLGGTVHLESQPGLGSRFSVSLPLRYGAEVVKAGHAVAPGQSMRVLIVDDDEASRYVVRTHLSGYPFEFAEASSGGEALRQATKLQPSLIILDLGLPDMDGQVVLRELKETPGTANIPVVINTSRDLNAEQRAELQTMVHGILWKNADDPTRAEGCLRELARLALNHA